jgi:hypothetical protein
MTVKHISEEIMRYILALMLLFTGLNAYAGQPVNINDTLTVTADITPDTMTSYVTVSTLADSFSDVAAKMERASKIIKNNSEICSFNSYRISPRYTYDNGKRMDDGFEGYLSSPCSFTEIDSYNDLLNDLDSLSAELSVSVSPISWTTNPDRMDAMQTQLKMDLIKEIYSILPAYSGATQKQCSLASVDYTGSTGNVYAPVVMRSEAKINMSAPDRSDKTVSVSANISLLCK